MKLVAICKVPEKLYIIPLFLIPKFLLKRSDCLLCSVSQSVLLACSHGEIQCIPPNPWVFKKFTISRRHWLSFQGPSLTFGVFVGKTIQRNRTPLLGWVEGRHQKLGKEVVNYWKIYMLSVCDAGLWQSQYWPESVHVTCFSWSIWHHMSKQHEASFIHMYVFATKLALCQVKSEEIHTDLIFAANFTCQCNMRKCYSISLGNVTSKYDTPGGWLL